jgi:thiosulfate dehydrogenase [quinone] large subunit
MKNSDKYLYLVFLILGFVYLRSSYGKFAGGTFVSTLGETLTKFAAKNPYTWFKSFLESVAIPNAAMFGQLTLWGEVFAGVSVFGSALYLLLRKGNNLVWSILLLGLTVGAFLNGVFWLASGWTSPSTDGLNLVMFVCELVGILFVIAQLRSK